MTPEEKAKELIDRFRPYCIDVSMYNELNTENAKQCALIAVDETLIVLKEMPITVSTKFYIYYWQQVKEAINKIILWQSLSV